MEKKQKEPVSEKEQKQDKTLNEKVLSIRTLDKDEIECRIGMAKQNGCSLLLYKDARVDMKLLDEVFGPMGWKRDHEVVNGNLFCTISVWDDTKKEWVSKQDVGVESNTEKEKGQASDAFKRAGFNWGIGRELYTAPFIWINFKEGEAVSRGSSWSTYTKFSVQEIEYNDRKEISKLTVTDDKGEVRYEYPAKKKPSGPAQPAQNSRTATDNVYKGLELDAAIKEIKSVKSWDEANAVWQKHLKFQNNREFREACMEITRKYPRTK